MDTEGLKNFFLKSLYHLFVFNEVWEQINCTVLKKSLLLSQVIKLLSIISKTHFFFSASCWSCRRCLPETWIWCWLAGSKIITFLTVFYQSVYNGLYIMACLKSCCRKPSMWVIEGCWLQKMELMKAGSVFWRVTYLVLVCWDTKQVDFTLLEISFKFPCMSE